MHRVSAREAEIKYGCDRWNGWREIVCPSHAPRNTGDSNIFHCDARFSTGGERFSKVVIEYRAGKLHCAVIPNQYFQRSKHICSFVHKRSCSSVDPLNMKCQAQAEDSHYKLLTS